MNETTAIRHPRLATLTMIALALGIAAGLFFGEYCQRLAIIGDIFVGLLRMTVLPFIVASLIANIGRLTIRQSKRTARVGGAVLLVLWLLALATVFALGRSFPAWAGGAFYSSALLEAPRELDLVRLFIPTNIFASLAENQVPAVVLLSICVGLALSTVPQREVVITGFDVLAKVLIRVSGAVAQFTPIGVFAIAASTSGTLAFADLERLHAYLLTYGAGALFLGLLALPMLAAAFTPFKYWDVLSMSRNAVLTAFVTGKLIIVLPLLIEETERMMEQYGLAEHEDAPSADLLYPLAYPFPHVGKLLGMLFIPFVASFVGKPLAAADYPALLGSGLFSYFGGPVLAMPFLLNLMELPHDAFQLFLMLGVIEGRLADALGAMHLIVFTLLTLSGCLGLLRFQVKSIARYGLAVLAAGILMTSGLRYAIPDSLAPEESRQGVVLAMQLLVNPTDAEMAEPAPNPEPLRDGESLLGRIRRRGVLRVGYNDDQVPFAYRNLRNDLVGFDIDMAHALARDLNVTLEFVKFQRDQLDRQLAEDHFDVAMAGLVATLERAEVMEHTEPYQNVTLGLVVPDFRSRNFRTLKEVRRRPQLKLGVVGLTSGVAERLRRSMPDAELVTLAQYDDYFDNPELVDALLTSAETGSALTMLHPEFEIVVPQGLRVELPLTYFVGQRDRKMREFLNHWVMLRRRDGTMQEYYDHWVLGKTEKGGRRRWSVIRDVLHWVE